MLSKTTTAILIVVTIALMGQTCTSGRSMTPAESAHARTGLLVAEPTPMKLLPPRTRDMPSGQQTRTETEQNKVRTERIGADGFDAHAFPPPLPDTEWHRDGWIRNDCMRCHETGVTNAPEVQHRGMPEILMTAKCRSCHVLIPGLLPRSQREGTVKSSQAQDRFDDHAFPPMIPNSSSHHSAWAKDDCLMCHQPGIQGAPILQHKGLPTILLKSKCRTCHVQVRAIEASGAEGRRKR